MNGLIDELASVVEAELAVGEELYRNLQAERQAILAWDSAKLAEFLEAKEGLLHSLGKLEESRFLILGSMGRLRNSDPLRDHIRELPEGSPERLRLSDLRERSHSTFLKIQADERYLQGLMANLLAYIRQALDLPAKVSAPLYGETGTVRDQRPDAGLMYKKV